MQTSRGVLCRQKYERATFTISSFIHGPILVRRLSETQRYYRWRFRCGKMISSEVLRTLKCTVALDGRQHVPTLFRFTPCQQLLFTLSSEPGWLSYTMSWCSTSARSNAVPTPVCTLPVDGSLYDSHDKRGQEKIGKKWYCLDCLFMVCPTRSLPLSLYLPCRVAAATCCCSCAYCAVLSCWFVCWCYLMDWA